MPSLLVTLVARPLDGESCKRFSGVCIWMFPKIMGKPPNHPLKNRDFHEINHPFFGGPLFLKTPI